MDVLAALDKIVGKFDVISDEKVVVVIYIEEAEKFDEERLEV